MLAVSHLSIEHPNHRVLDDFNLTLNSGEIFALLGKSGSGKSSVLRFIAGLDGAKSGDCVLNGVPLSAAGRHIIAPESRQIGMVFQDYALFPHLTVAQNIAFGIHHLSKNARQSRVKSLLSMMDLPNIEAKYPHQLSGGEAQRVALARALARQPKLLLLDEPFSSLDKNHRAILVPQVREILKESQVTSILVTHDKTEAAAFADTLGSIQNKQLTIEI